MREARRFATFTLIAAVAVWTVLSCAPRTDPGQREHLPSWVTVQDDSRPAQDDEYDREEAGPSGAMKALDYWATQRAYPDPKIPDADYGIALHASRALRNQLAAPAESAVPAWEPLGPANVGGRTLCLAVHPDDADVLFAGSASGGLWKTTTGGVGAAAWNVVDTGFPALGVSTIAIDPNDGDVMYIGTGEAYSYAESTGGEVIRTTRGSYGVGILKTDDGGTTWTHSLDWTYEQSRGIWMIRIHPTNSDILYAATTEGIYKSTDAGDSWTLVHAVIMATDVRIHPLFTGFVFAAHGNFGSTGHGIYRSADGGQNWTLLAGGLPASWTGKAQLSLSATSPTTIFASIADSNSGLGLYRSDDRGGSWTQRNSTDYALYQGWYSHYVVVSPFDGDTLFTGGIEIWRSEDGGSSLVPRSSWQSVFLDVASPPEGPIGESDYAHADHHFAIWHPTDPNTIFFASDGGVFRTRDLGNTFESLIGGYQTSQFYNGFSNSASDPDFAIGGLQDNFVVIYNGTNAWTRVIGGDGTWTAQNPVVGSTVYAAAQSLFVQRSYDSGVNWTSIDPPTMSGDVTAFVAPYVLSQDDPSVLYAGRSRVYRSDDEGTNWVATNGGNQLSSGNPVISLATAPADVDVAYAGTAPIAGRARVFRTRDGGSSWDDVTGALPDRYPSDITVDPGNPDRVFATFMGFGTSHLFTSSDGGDNWTDIGGNLPDIPTSAVEIDPEHPDVIYVGTDLGTYASLDGGTTWQPFNDGMPLAMVNDLKVFLPDRRIRAATHGNGAWEREMFGPGNCAAPQAATDLTLFHTGGVGGTTTLSWSPPLDSGAAPAAYDTLSSELSDGFGAGASSVCVESDGADTTSVDSTDPGSGEVLFYLVRAQSVCGLGPMGVDSFDNPRSAQPCPAS